MDILCAFFIMIFGVLSIITIMRIYLYRFDLAYILIPACFITLSIWLIIASNTPSKYTEKSYTISNKTLDNGIKQQVFTVGEDEVSITELFPSIYPDGYTVKVKVFNKWKKGMHFSISPDMSYTIIRGDNKELTTRYIKHSTR